MTRREDVFVEVVLMIVGTILGVVGLSLFATVRDLLGRGDYFPAVLLALLVLMLVREARRVLRRPRRPDSVRTEIFSGLSVPTGSQIWDRSARTGQIADAILAGGDVPTVITGPSGTGKSTLIRSSLPAEIERRSGREVIIVDQFGRDRIDAVLHQARGPGERPVVVLDQIEAIILPSAPVSGDEDRAARVGRAVTDLMELGCPVVVAVRSERYVDLRRLGIAMPSPDDAVFIDRVRDEAEDEAWVAFRARIEELFEDAEVETALLSDLRRSGPFTPMELQMVGAVHEIRVKHPEAGAPDTVAPDLAAHWLLRRELAGHDEPRTSIEILYVLAQLRAEREETDAQNLANLIDEPIGLVTTSLDQLVEVGIVVRRANGRTMLAHDHLTAIAEQVASGSLEPAERDTLRDLVGRYLRNRAGLTRVLRQTGPDASRAPQLLIASVVLLAVAGLVRALPWERLQAALMPIDVLEPMRGDGWFDGLYLAVVVPHVAWSWYIFLHAHRAYRFTDRTPGDRLMTKALLLTTMLSFALGLLLPAFWVANVAIGGLFAAAKTVHIARSSQQESVAVWFRERARKTGFNAAVTLAIGLAWGFAIIGGGVSASIARSGQYVLMLLLLAVAIDLRRDHISERGARLIRILVRRAAVAS